MSIRVAICPLCDAVMESDAEWLWHRELEHQRDWDPCVICCDWDEVTEETEYGAAHEGCAMQVGRDEAEAHFEREEAS